MNTDLETNCLFCEIPQSRVIVENELAFAIRDGFPVTKYHTLIIPKRHVRTYFNLTSEENRACHELLKLQRSQLMKLDPLITGFNIGMNSGHSAGQTVFHCHIHLIPRRDGDVENQSGGVRHIIPNKGYY